MSIIDLAAEGQESRKSFSPSSTNQKGSRLFSTDFLGMTLILIWRWRVRRFSDRCLGLAFAYRTG